MDIVSLRNLNLILVLIAYCCSPARSHFLECASYDNCMCFEYDNIEIQCPKVDPEISVKLTPKNHVEMQCLKSTTPFFDINILPELNATDASVFKLEYCYLNTTFTEILRKFNMTTVKYLSFETLAEGNNDRVIDISKEMFDSLDSLEGLSIDFSTLNLNENFLENTPNLRRLSMTKNDLTGIGNYFSNVPKLEVLDLTRNQIGFIPDQVFKELGNLTKLYLWNNNLTSLTKSMLAGLSNLQVLELSNNHIQQLDKDALSELHKLVNASLRNNNIEKAYSYMFINNSNLENIRLSYNRKLVLSDYVFANITSLKSVDLSYDDINELPENTFINCDNLQYITLKGNRLEDVSENTFYSLKKLKELDISNNLLRSLSAQVLSPLQSLEKLDLSNNQLTTIAANQFRKLTKLKVLNLSKNKIAFIDLIAFRGLEKSLTSLDLSYNYWDDMANPLIDSTPLNDCLNLEELILNHNRIGHYPDIQALLKLRKLDLSYNLIDELLVSRFAQSTQYTFEVDLSSNKIEQVNFHLAEQIAKLNTEYFDAVHYNGASTVITINNNPITCDCSNFDLIQYDNGEMEVIKTLVEFKMDKLYCSNFNNTLVKSLKPYHVDCPVLTGCPSPCTCSYMPYNTAVTVDCSFRNLTSYPQFYINITDNQQTILNLSGNYLEMGPVVGLNYDNITSLDLSGNYISEITWIPPYVKELNLNENSLTKLSSNFINMLKNSSSLEQLHLKENVWICDCQALDLQKYLMEYYRKVNSSDVFCDDNKIQLVDITDLCKVSPYLTVLLPIALTVLLCFAVAVAIYYRYQTEIKIYLYAKHLCLWFVTEEEVDKDKTFDVFLSYAHQDVRFVIEHLLPELEHGETRYRVCVHERDWIPGEFITKQVISSVKDSRRTLVVLSNNFVDSVWGKLEFRTAHTEALSEGRARVIVVIYGDLDESKLDDELKSYLKTNTYVKWGDKYFWNKLKYALPHSKNSFYERNTKHAKMMLKIDDKFDLIKNPPSPATTSTPPITLDPALLQKNQIRINIPMKVEGEDSLLMRPS